MLVAGHWGVPVLLASAEGGRNEAPRACSETQREGSALDLLVPEVVNARTQTRGAQQRGRRRRGCAAGLLDCWFGEAPRPLASSLARSSRWQIKSHRTVAVYCTQLLKTARIVPPRAREVV